MRKEPRLLRVGVLGCGPISQFAHLEACRKARNAELYAICDVADDLVEKMAAIHAPQVTYTDYKAMSPTRTSRRSSSGWLISSMCPPPERPSRPASTCSRGTLDYDRYLENLRGVGFEGPVILHGLGESEVELSVAFLRAKLVNAAYSEHRER